MLIAYNIIINKTSVSQYLSHPHGHSISNPGQLTISVHVKVFFCNILSFIVYSHALDEFKKFSE